MRTTKRLVAILTALTFLGLSALAPLPAFAGEQGDPLHIGAGEAPGALQGAYRTGNGQFQWLMLATPRACLDGSGHEPTGADDCELVATVWFYTAACNRVGVKTVPLTANDVAVLPLHSTSVTSNPSGGVLVGGTLPSGPFTQISPASASIIGQMFYIDINRGIGRLQHMAAIASGSFGDGTSGGPGWSSYRPAHVLLFAPPDDGANFFNTLLIQCPTGVSVTSAGTVFGTSAKLGGDMFSMAVQADGGDTDDFTNSSGTSGTDDEDVLVDNACDSGESGDECSGAFAENISAAVFNTDEELLGIVDNIPCRCLGVNPGSGFVEEVRLSALLAAAASSESYWEISSVGGPAAAKEDHFAAAVNIQVVADSLNLNFYTDLHRAVAGNGVLSTFAIDP